MIGPRIMPGAFGQHALRTEIYIVGDLCSLKFIPDMGLSTEVGIWTNREGIEALRDLCNVLLVTEPSP